MVKPYSCMLVLLAICMVNFQPSFLVGNDSQATHRDKTDPSSGHAIVPGFERFAEVESITDQQRGMLLLNELNCGSCHKSELPWSIAPKQAPILTEVGGRILPEHFEAFMLAPHSVKPGTLMPDVLAGMSEPNRSQVASSIAHFLASTGEAVRQSTKVSMVSDGKQLFHSIGCVACHNPQESDVQIATSIPLGNLATKYTLPGLTEFLQNPHQIRPSGRMPQFVFVNQEAQSIAAYLLRDAVIDSKIKFAYYEGSWESLPDFSQLQPKSTGIAAGFELGVGPRDNEFGIVFTGYWTVTKADDYRFRITSDDGSRLLIDGKEVVTHDGIHPATSKEGHVGLSPGVHRVEVQFFEGGGGEELSLEVTGGGMRQVSLDSLLRADEAEAKKSSNAFELDLKLASQGKQYFQSVGCASCHQLELDSQLLVSTSVSAAKPLKAVAPEKGCLAKVYSDSKSPKFELSDFQIKCIAAAISSLNQPAQVPTTLAKSDDIKVHEKLLTLNCYSCHNREYGDDILYGGVVDLSGLSDEVFGREKWFTSNQQEMGDEGQHPPSLKSVGSKLKTPWLNHVLSNGAKDRPYMLTRMPKFGDDNLVDLAKELIGADRLENVVTVQPIEDEKTTKAHGRFFAGEEALSCIKCHTFGQYSASGIQAISLTTMNKRLNKDWFQAYMLRPSTFRRGTRMPESWPSGKSFYPEILEGNANLQIDAIWQFLSDGEDAAKPKGLVKSQMELQAVKSPKMYRNFIQGAGPRAIGVGYPEGVNLAFDAQLGRMALIWQENFIDASLHWNGRGQGFQPPLGENVLSFPESMAMSNSGTLAQKSAKDAWPQNAINKNDYRFMGYVFDGQRRPTFQYQVGQVEVLDQPIPVATDGRIGLKRQFTLSANAETVLFIRAAAGKSIVHDAKTATIDGQLKLSFTGPATLNVQDCSEGRQLIVTLEVAASDTEVTMTYDW